MSNKRMHLANSDLSMVFMYYLARHCGHHRLAALFSGTAYAFACYRVTHMRAHLSLSTTEWIPLYILFLLLILKENDAIRSTSIYLKSLALSIIFAVNLYSHPYYAIHVTAA